MATIDYPASLPCPQSASFTPADRVRRSDAAGAMQFVGIERDFRGTQEVTFVLSATQAAIFKEWWEDTLLRGGMWFNATGWPLPSAWGATAVRRFRSPPQWAALGAGYYKVSASMELRGRGEPVGITLWDPCSLFTSEALHGYCLNFTQPTSMLDEDSNVAAVGEPVRFGVPEGGTFGTFQAFDVEVLARPLAGDGYLQLTGLEGPVQDSTLQRAGVYDSITGGGFTACVVATQPAEFEPDDYASLLGNQDGSASNQSQFRLEFTPTGAYVITFNSAAGFNYVAGAYSSTPGERSVLIAVCTGGIATLYRNGVAIASGTGYLNSGSISRHEIGISRAGTNEQTHGYYQGNMYAAFFIDRAFTAEEVALYSAWGLAL